MERTKVCSIFEPSFHSIMLLPSDEEKLQTFIDMCNYAYYGTEPEYPDTQIGAYQKSLWNQLKMVTDRSQKRSYQNSINGKKGGRAKKAESDGFLALNDEIPDDVLKSDK